MKALRKFVSALIILTVSSSYIFSQECDNDFFKGFDFRSQSIYGELSPGDTLELNVVVYSRQDYRIFVCNDPELGDLDLSIYKLERVSKKKVQDIRKTVEVKYQLDENGEVAYPEENDYEPVPIDSVVVMDTIWTTERVWDEVELYNKKSASKPYWDKSIEKTHRLKARIIVPEGDPNYLGSVEVYVGRRSTKSGKFKRFEGGVK